MKKPIKTVDALAQFPPGFADKKKAPALRIAIEALKRGRDIISRPDGWCRFHLCVSSATRERRPHEIGSVRGKSYCALGAAAHATAVDLAGHPDKKRLGDVFWDTDDLVRVVLNQASRARYPRIGGVVALNDSESMTKSESKRAVLLVYHDAIMALRRALAELPAKSSK